MWFPNDKELVQIHGRALRAANLILEDRKERVKDSTLLAVWLLGIFEVLYHPLYLNLPFYISQNNSQSLSLS